jgi:hypothetical protein
MSEADDAFLAYGRSMAKAVGIEQFLRLALMEHEVRSVSKLPAQPDFTRFLAKLLKMDFGQLLQQVYQKYSLQSEFLAVMRTAKDGRDYLAHNFWIGHLGSLRSERGLRNLVRHCAIIEEQLDRVCHYLIEMTGVDAARFVAFIDMQAQSQEPHDEWEALLAAAEASFTPPLTEQSHGHTTSEED